MNAREHSPRPTAASNRTDAARWRLLGAACRHAAAGRATLAGVVRVLESALAATGAERAFVVSEAEPGRERAEPRVEAIASCRSDGCDRPSRSVLARALAGRPRVWADGAALRALADGASVRSLGLRFVISAPVPLAPPRRGALVLDSRLPVERGPDLRGIVDAFAGLSGLMLDRMPREAGLSGERTRAELIGSSALFLEVLDRARRVAAWPLPVLVTGESGTGKESVARLLHRDGNRRGPFVAVNCSAISEGLLESELFGAVRGAYTGIDRDRPGLVRLAHGGTLFLDEIGDMSAPMQAKLLRVIQEGRVRPVGDASEHAVEVRIVAATNRDLARLVARGDFRADLYYRVAKVELHVPPLRDRPEDIPDLVRHLGSRLVEQTGCRPLRWSAAALERLRRHGWPGNVRELEAVLARAILRSGGGSILPRHLEIPEVEACAAGTGGDNLERRMVEAALRQSGYVLTRAAARIGWSRQKLARRMIALGVRRP